MPNEKICPIMSRPVVNGPDADPEFFAVFCQREACRFWTSVYSTEGLKQSPECSIVLEALTNADGLFVV